MKLLSPLLTAVVTLAIAGVATADVTMSLSSVQPVVGTIDQANLLTDGPQNNQQDFSDNAGPLGQTFTTPAGSAFNLTAFSFKGLDNGGNTYSQTAPFPTSFSVRISSVVGTTLTPIMTYSAIPYPTTTAQATAVTGHEWFTFNFTGVDSLVLTASTLYSFETYSDAGYAGFSGSNGDVYAGGFSFNTTGTSRNFDSVTAQDRGNDRTFVANLAAAPVPEPGTVAMTLAGLAGVVVFGIRRRRLV